MKYTACLDLEGVLIPELWPHISLKSGISELMLTTRDEPDYTKLMTSRIALLKKNNLNLIDVVQICSDLTLLPDALQFVRNLQLKWNVVLVSDAFTQMIEPFWRLLGHPTLRCHSFMCDKQGYVVKPVYSRKSGKHEVVEEYLEQGHHVLAVGDAYNDLTMLRKASLGFLFNPSEKTASEALDLAITYQYNDIIKASDEYVTYN